MMTRVALVGAPNCGKTTLYNWLTGSRYRTVNYPGSTVEVALGRVAAHVGQDMEFVDTPGVYSLQAKSADEEVTRSVLLQGFEGRPIDGVLVVLDGTQTDRQLVLVEEIRRTGLPFAVILTMGDLLRRESLTPRTQELSRSLGVPVEVFEGPLAGGLREVYQAARSLGEKTLVSEGDPREWFQILWGDTFAARERLAAIADRTKRWDRWLLHPVAGLMIFAFVMASLFTSIFWLAAPLMDAVESLFLVSGDFLRERGGEGAGMDFLVDGVLASVAAVMVFAPQIFILFVGISFLEASGYLARAATLIDRPFSAIGLSGRSFVPILSGFSCAVPAMMATRNISSARDRWITTFIIPLMSCSARLPVYALLLAFLFRDSAAWKPGVALAVIYLGSLLIGALAAGVLHRFLPLGQGSFLLMDLPLLRRPRLRVSLRQSLTRTWSYVRRSGPIIFVIALLMWVGTTFPRGGEDLTVAQQVEQSYAGRLGTLIEPLVEPMGVDWRVGVGLISAFAAREVFVSTLAVAFNITEEDEEAQSRGLLEKMSAATNRRGEPVFTTASAWGLIVFFMIAMQCMATFAVARRESGSWRFAVGQLVVFNIAAYMAAVMVVAALS